MKGSCVLYRSSAFQSDPIRNRRGFETAAACSTKVLQAGQTSGDAGIDLANGKRKKEKRRRLLDLLLLFREEEEKKEKPSYRSHTFVPILSPHRRFSITEIASAAYPLQPLSASLAFFISFLLLSYACRCYPTRSVHDVNGHLLSRKKRPKSLSLSLFFHPVYLCSSFFSLLLFLLFPSLYLSFLS